MDESKNLSEINDYNSKMIKTERIGLEAEDIVADAIKLNVDDDLNEQRDDHLSDNLNKKASSVKNGLPNALDNAIVEDEPNYEIDEVEEEQQSDNKDALNKKNDESRKKSDKSITNKLNADSKGNSSLSNTSNKNYKEKNGEDLNLDKNEKKSDKSKGDDKSNENKSLTSNKDESTKDVKKDGLTSEAESKSSKNKSSSSKTKETTKSSEGKGTCPNDKIVWVSGLSSNTRASDLQSLFKKYGKVIGAKIIKNTRIPGSRCFGFITMETTEQAEKCIQNLNKTELDGRTITVEKNRLVEDKKKQREKSVEKSDKEGKESESKKESKDNEKPRDKKDRSRSPRRKSHSPIKRFSHKPNFNNRRPIGSFGIRRGGGLGPRPPFGSGPNPMMVRKFEAERLMRRREMRAKERRRAEDYRKQRDLERKQQEERDKLEREKMRLKIERDRLEREKADFLRAEREKARIERERIEREREELRRKQVQIPHSRIDDSRMRNSLISGKRPYDDLYWDDRKRFPASSSLNPGRSAYEDQETSYNDYPYDIQSSDYNRRKLEALTSSSLSRDYDSKRAIQDSSRSAGHDRDDRRTSNGTSSQIGYYRDSRPSLSSRERDSRRSNNGGREDNNDWKSNVDRRSDARYLDKNSLSQAQATSQSYLSASRSYGGERDSDAWSVNDRLSAASSLNKLSYPPVAAMTDNRSRPQSSIPQQIIGPASTIGMYNPSANVPINNLMSNPNYGNGNLNSSYRRY